MHKEVFTVQIPQMRLDQLLTKHFSNHSRTYFQSLITNGLVLVNGAAAKNRTSPDVGDLVTVHFERKEPLKLQPEKIPLDILYEDEHLLAINKPAHMVVHPGPGHLSGTLVNALLYHCPSLPEDALRPGIVHRLDRETSGVMIVAKTDIMKKACVKLFASREIKKLYTGFTTSNPSAVTVCRPIGRHPIHRQRMAIVDSGKEAITRFTPLATSEKYTCIACYPQTGRTHQIRVHLKFLNAPILGDLLYGQRAGLSRHLLHARSIAFIHPFTHQEIEIEAPFPSNFTPCAKLQGLLQSVTVPKLLL